MIRIGGGGASAARDERRSRHLGGGTEPAVEVILKLRTGACHIKAGSWRLTGMVPPMTCCDAPQDLCDPAPTSRERLLRRCSLKSIVGCWLLLPMGRRDGSAITRLKGTSGRATFLASLRPRGGGRTHGSAVVMVRQIPSHRGAAAPPRGPRAGTARWMRSPGLQLLQRSSSLRACGQPSPPASNIVTVAGAAWIPPLAPAMQAAGA
jgi:hypothetical protein